MNIAVLGAVEAQAKLIEVGAGVSRPALVGLVVDALAAGGGDDERAVDRHLEQAVAAGDRGAVDILVGDVLPELGRDELLVEHAHPAGVVLARNWIGRCQAVLGDLDGLDVAVLGRPVGVALEAGVEDAG